MALTTPADISTGMNLSSEETFTSIIENKKRSSTFSKRYKRLSLIHLTFLCLNALCKISSAEAIDEMKIILHFVSSIEQMKKVLIPFLSWKLG